MIDFNAIYEKKSEMTFIGFSTQINPNEGNIKCPQFWDEEYSKKYARLWQTMKPETAEEKAVLENGIGMFAICDEKDGYFEYSIVGLYRGGEVPAGMKLFKFPESEWAVFSTKGALPDSLQTLNAKVWQEWYPNEGKNLLPNGNAMIEVYSAGDMSSDDYECGIWVPVCRKNIISEREIL